MKTKLMIVMGMVALGLLRQITAQTPTPTVSPMFVPTQPEWHVVNTVYDWNNMNVPLKTSQWSRTVAPNGDIIIRTYDNWSDITGTAAPAGPTTSLITNMICQVIGDVQLWQCFRAATPPDGKGFFPPAGLGPCSTWPGNLVIISTTYGVPCPLKLDSFPVEFRYYMPTCTGENKEVGRWNVNKREITGNCNNGYTATTKRVFISPDCQAGGQGCQPLLDQDLFYSGDATGDWCNGTIYNTLTFGPFTVNASVHVSGTVDDDVRINGTILDPTCCQFGTDCPANGQHNFDTTFALPAGTPITMDIINNFPAGVSLVGHITVMAQ